MKVKITACAAAVLALALSAAPAAAAQPPLTVQAPWLPKGATVREAYLPNCGADYFMPCKGAPWHLLLRDGRWVPFRDAARYATRADGSRADEVEDSPAPFAVSADGRAVAYVRARDGRVVVRKAPGGKPRVLAAYGKGVGTRNVALTLSADGARLLVVFEGGTGKRPSLVVDVATGERAAEVPAGNVPLGFSADGDEVLATRAERDNTVKVVAHALDGSSVSATPPQQVVARGTALALAADGHTVLALSLTAEGLPSGLRPYDLEAGAWTGPARRVRPKRLWPSLRWGPGGRLELVATESVAEEGRSSTWIYALDPATGSARRIDEYTIHSGVPEKR
ncbi:hypothetical protein [Nonomuraea pusilla]|uniref:WD40-like Beta Propeller Repeat n=1 Tax=Nonomuraea pusilla TaxID=46177 RepID=A0A1H7SJR5_9ACTN|nr:hypothetical protein [Nonomuraea pusilla]SEL71677.1 hypothetical protein SAMN05660976_03194 [Nonomuraea pusilla]